MQIVFTSFIFFIFGSKQPEKMLLSLCLAVFIAYFSHLPTDAYLTVP